jgi:S-formylglutathione hydrolase FrmB
VLNWSLLSGPLPMVLNVAAIGAAAALCWCVCKGRRPGWLKVAAAVGCTLGSVVAVGVVATLARRVWMLFPDQLTLPVYIWAVTAVLAVTIACAAAVLDRRRSSTVAGLMAAVVVVAASANQINAVFGAYPTAADALGFSPYDRVALAQVDSRVRVVNVADPLAARWSRPTQLPMKGKVAAAPIPAPVSHFVAREAQIYLPPAYFADPRPRLPVLVLIAGEPGSPLDWLGAGNLVETMDSFAASHGGLAPVVVVPDGTGSQFGDPLCLDSRRGNADSYLARDVPTWIKTHLTVDDDPHSWAVGGLSYGGTCALQLATNHPDVYPTFLDISGAAEPSLGDEKLTVDAAFGGDAAAYHRVNPLDLLRNHRYPNSSGAIVAGTADSDALRDSRVVYAATRGAGMNCRYLELPGGHDWRVFSAALARELPWLADQIGVT